MKRTVLLLAICLFVLLSACSRRDQTGDASSAASVSGGGDASAADSTSPPEESEVDNREYIADPEQVDAAREIVQQLLERAVTADTIYRGAVSRDSLTATITMETGDYSLVVDEQFPSVDSLKEYLSNTFVSGGEGEQRLESIWEEHRYLSINGELYVLQNAYESTNLLTLGSWKTDDMQLLEMSDSRIVVNMTSQLLGDNNGKKDLTIVNQNGQWLLDDSYFLD